MKLNLEGKKKLRELVERQLALVPEGQKIKIPKENLEYLLFDERIVEYNKRLRIPVWSGEFLSKLDLSEVSFSDVGWDLSNLYDYDKKETVCYKNTNAIIDFQKSYEYKRYGKIMINQCDFSGTSLAHVDTSKIGEIKFSILTNTGMIFKNIKGMHIESSNFSGCDMKDASISVKNSFTLGNCFRNTGLQIYIDVESIESTDGKQTLKRYLQNAVEKDFLSGCYVRGKKFLSNEEKIALAEKTKKEYEQFKEDMLKSYSQDIESQLVFGKK